ncbi:hypothetical protein FB45DRAFT_918491 [Roridomyces roridus]|uniref:DUF6533 domain-containing protein n=1 Tax=Roridomyces roridus TaxID=1738132 RepID=A0AAD7BRI6_9AGAR|nr:hypothetical protein FB45DRAFT_918491 [Roridomyces roridus]
MIANAWTSCGNGRIELLLTGNRAPTNKPFQSLFRFRSIQHCAMDTAVPPVTTLHDSQIVAYIPVAFFALLVYDTLLTMSQEIEYIWKSKMGPVKCLYLFARYTTFVTASLAMGLHFQWGKDAATCRTILRFTRMFTGFEIGVTEIILLIRTYALYSRPRKMLVSLVLLWIVIGTLNIWGMIGWARSLTVKSEPFTNCILEDSSNYILICYGARLVGETILAALTLAKYIPILGEGNNSNLVATFYQDGILWYLAMLSVLTTNVVLQIAARPSLKYLADAPMRVLHALLACRLVLHVRVTADEGPLYYTWRDSESTRTVI